MLLVATARPDEDAASSPAADLALAADHSVIDLGGLAQADAAELARVLHDRYHAHGGGLAPPPAAGDLGRDAGAQRVAHHRPRAPHARQQRRRRAVEVAAPALNLLRHSSPVARRVMHPGLRRCSALGGQKARLGLAPCRPGA
jgi:hypothetical protein